MGQYSIKDIETLSGIKAHTLRIWEQRYSFLEPNRTETNIRYYNDNQLKKILNISLLYHHGYKISKIDKLTDDLISQEVLKIKSESTDFSIFLDDLIHSSLHFDEDLFRFTFHKIFDQFSFEQGITEVIFPFLNRIGILWTTGSIRPIQEHFISNLIRKKLIFETEKLDQFKNSNSKRFVLFLPEHEMHELLLLFCDYLLKKEGYTTYYIGNCVPWEDVEFIKDKFHPDGLVTFFSVPLPKDALELYLENMSNSFKNCTILVGGLADTLKSFHYPSNIKICDSYNSFVNHIRK